MKNIIFLLLSILIGIGFYHIIALSYKEFNPLDIGMGIATTGHDAFFQNLQIAQSMGGSNEIINAAQKWQSEGYELALWLGNSQLHSINYFLEGDQLAVAHANIQANKRGTNLRYIQLSSPNINLLELPIYYLTLRQKKINPKWIILGVPYRSFQLSGIRSRFLDSLSQLELLASKTPSYMFEFYTKALNLGNTSRDKTKHYPQDKVEERLIKSIEKNWEAYRYRGKLRSKIKILPGQYYQKWFVKKYLLSGASTVIKENLKMFEEFLKLTQHDQVNVLVYQPPDPNMESIMDYNQEEQLTFFQQIEEIIGRYPKAHFRNLQLIVEDDLWGRNNRGWLDIFHFKGKGHQILGESLDTVMTKLYEVQ